jgi:hypothetical protein
MVQAEALLLQPIRFTLSVGVGVAEGFDFRTLACLPLLDDVGGDCALLGQYWISIFHNNPGCAHSAEADVVTASRQQDMATTMDNPRVIIDSCLF